MGNRQVNTSRDRPGGPKAHANAELGTDLFRLLIGLRAQAHILVGSNAPQHATALR